MIEYVCVIIFLLICSISDLKSRKISVGVCIAGGLAGIVINLSGKMHSPGDLIIGAALGMAFIGISVITRQKIGLGDSFVILDLGLLVGGIQCFNIILWAFILCTLLAFLGMLIFKMRIKSSLPFVPFITIASVIQFILK